MSCDRIVVMFPERGSDRRSVRREPQAVTTCCSFVPEKFPGKAFVMEVGDCIVREYINIEEVVAILKRTLAGKRPNRECYGGRWRMYQIDF
jgi:hypothetical protein